MKKKTQIDYAKQMHNRYLNMKIAFFAADILGVSVCMISLFKADNSVKTIILYLMIFYCSLFTLGFIICSKKCKKIENDIKKMKENQES